MPINNADILRRDVITRVIKHLKNGDLLENVDDIPYVMRPRGGEISRCCIYKDRAMLKYRTMGVLGFGIDDEKDERTRLSQYAVEAMERTEIGKNPISVMTEACSACVKTNYVVTNMCRGCVARPCESSCNKNAIFFLNGQAHIETSKCVNCGLCQKNCPFHAIIYQPVPCEESCPVGAITKDVYGKEAIDHTKCIYCGRCVSACPFGAVMERSHIVDVFKVIVNPNKPVVAIVAPAIAGQFKAPLHNIMSAVKQIGFDQVQEVARGADVTTHHEAEEFIEKMEAGEPFMTTSCCPSYYRLVNKHIKDLKPFVSHTRSPMYYSAEIVKAENPNAAVVFIGPCLAKRHEANKDPNVDYVLSFEEVATALQALEINIESANGIELDSNVDPSSRGYATTGGVADAVQKKVGDRADMKPLVINGISKQTIRELKGFPNSCPGNMVEVMACEGGCVGGCNVIANPKVATRQVQQLAQN